MNGISMNTTNYSTPLRGHNIAFKGQLGDSYLEKLSKSERVVTEMVMEDVQGTFGLKKDKVQDVLDSFIRSIKGLYQNIRSKESEIHFLKRKNEELQAALKTEEKRNKMLNEARTASINELNAQLKAKEKEVAEAKAYAAKHNMFAQIKSIEDVGTVMPDEAIEIINEMAENERAARKSMIEYLFTGKGQEEALKQIERNNRLFVARKDGITEISDVKKVLKNTDTSYGSHTRHYITHLIEHTLYGYEKAKYLVSPKVQEVVLNNAMALLKPHCDESDYYAGHITVKNNLANRFKRFIDFHEKLEEHKENFIKRAERNGQKITKVNTLDGFVEEPCIEYEVGGKKHTISFKDLYI